MTQGMPTRELFLEDEDLKGMKLAVVELSWLGKLEVYVISIYPSKMEPPDLCVKLFWWNIHGGRTN